MKLTIIFLCSIFICIFSGCRSTTESEMELEKTILNCATHPPSEEEIAILCKDKDASINMILSKANNYTGVQNGKLFFTLYVVCYQSGCLLPDNIDTYFPLLNESISEYIKLLYYAYFLKESKKGEIWPDPPSIFLIMCGNNAVPFLEKAAFSNDSVSEKAAKILIDINAIREKRKTLSEVLR